MRDAEEFSGQRSGPARVRPAYRRPRPGAGGRPGAGRIRYAHSGALPRDEAFCTVPQGPAGYLGGDAGAEGTRDVGDLGNLAEGGNGGGSGSGSGSEDLEGGIWLTEFPPGDRHTDRWVLVCGGIAAAAAFAAAFFASGGMATHPVSPGAAVPGIVSQACPSPAPAPAP
jgi:hypothetical protein